jgi:type I restriction enzyme M protein
VSELRNHANLIWGIAELLRGDYKQSQYGDVILPLVVMRRLDQVLEPSRDAVIARGLELEASGVENVELALRNVAKQQFFNRSRLRFHQLLDDPGNIADHLRSYIDGYSALARQVVEKFEFEKHIDRLKSANLLYKVIARVCEVDLHPDRVSNAEMGAIFEELIRRFAEASNETAGEHFTPREVVRLMVNLLLDGDEDVLREPGTIRSVFDCACGTGGMLSEAETQIHRYNPRATVRLYGQELNPQSYAICLADMLVKGQDASHIVFGNSLSDDGHKGAHFHYCIANPPFGVDWSKVEEAVRDEHADLGFDGRFGAGLPRKSDGQLLFLMHLLSKMRPPEKDGSRVAIVHNGSPCSPAAPAPARATSAVGSLRTTGSRRSLGCPSRSSTTPASPATSGCCPTARSQSARGSSSSLTLARCGRRCARALARSAAI